MNRSGEIMMKNQEIQGLRGFGAIVVFLSHFIGALPFALLVGNVNLKYTFVGIFFNGTIAVSMFFLLSGFYIYNSIGNEIYIKSYFKFLQKKALKLYPIYIVCILIGSILAEIYFVFNGSKNYQLEPSFLSFWNSQISPGDVISTLTMIGKFDSHLIDPPVWTMRAEMRMVLILPFIYTILKKFEDKFIDYFIVWLGFVILSTYLVKGLGVNTFEVFPIFMFGALLNYFINKGNNKLFEHKASGFSTMLFFIFGIILLGIGGNYFLGVKEVISDYFVSWITTIGWFIIIFLLLKYPRKLKIFANKPFVFIGNISYSFYLWHYIILLALRPIVSIETIGYVVYIVWGILSFGLTVILSILTEKFQEKLSQYFKKIKLL